MNKLNKRIIELIEILLILVSISMPFTLIHSLVNSPANASDLEFFKNDVSFWEEKQRAKNPKKKTITRPKQENKRFHWDKYLNIKNDEFFKEGNHLPPAPLMEATRNPTKKNIENFEKWVNLRNEARKRFIKAYADYKKKTVNIPDEQVAFINNRLAQIPEINVDNAKYSFTMYYDSNCPHCKKMVHTFKELNARGFNTIIKQVDRGRIKDDISPLVIVPASKNEIKSLIKKGKGTPTTVVSTKDGRTYSVSGYYPTNQLLSILSKRITKGGSK